MAPRLPCIAQYLVLLCFVVDIESSTGFCQSGYYMDDVSNQCKPCPEGSYTPVPNLAPKCQPCRQTCVNPDREEIKFTCSPTTDNTCVCKNGYYNAEPTSTSLLCVKRKCPPGQQEVHNGKYHVIHVSFYFR